MASFIPWYGKKRSRLKKLEQEFLEVLRDEDSPIRLSEGAETIRLAHIRALKEKRQKFAPSEKNKPIYEKIEQAIHWWDGVSTDAIIEAYRYPTRPPKLPTVAGRAEK
jgi:hypothetical protein